jgi:PAS domain-containing protein
MTVELPVIRRTGGVPNEDHRSSSELQHGVAKELSQAEKDLELQISVLQNMPAVAWTVTLDGRLDFINRFFLESIGRSLEECFLAPDVWNQSGNELPPFLRGLHPDHRECAAEIFWKGVRSGQGWAFEAPYFHPSDTRLR